jgi:hypothetical protein
MLCGSRIQKIPEERPMSDEQTRGRSLRRRIVFVVAAAALAFGALAWVYPPAGTTIEVQDSEQDTYQPPAARGATLWVDCAH